MTNDQVVKHLWIPARLAARQAFAGMTKRRNDKVFRMTNDKVVKQIESIITNIFLDDPEGTPAFERVL